MKSTQPFFPSDFRQGLKDGFPLALSIFAYGLVFGVLARQAGLSYWETVTMSALVVAGASQFVAVNMISAGAAAGQIILAAFLLNLRHLLMGATLAPYLSRVQPWKLAVLAHLTNDESYAVTIGRFQRHGGSAAFFLGAGTITFSAWLLSSALAGAVGDFIGDPRRYGLDFAFYGAFIGLLVPQLKDRVTWSAFTVAAVVSLVVSLVLPGKWYIIIAALLASLAGLGIERHFSTKGEGSVEQA
ncbi:MAG: AzlC family ABC transporter permease [Firmicutes bacterium]|nr:AzlC family ABC transporter permease [Bacillota bacterium]